MPLYDFDVIGPDGAPTGEVVEYLCSRLTFTDVDDLGRRIQRRSVHLIANIKTRWGDSHSYYDPDLRATVSSQRDIDRICESKGWVPVSDMPQGTLTTSVERMHRKAANDKIVDEQMQASMQKHGAAIGKAETPQEIAAWARVQEEVMPIQGMLDKSVPAAKTKLTDF